MVSTRMADAGPKSKLRAVWHSVLADHDRNMKELQHDLKELSQFARNKVRDLQDQRRMKRQQAASNFDLWEGVNQGVGSDILSHFKHDWAAVHHSTSSSSQKACELYSSILSLQQSMSQAHSIVSNACEELSQLPAIVKSVEESKDKVDKIRELMHSVEEGLEDYVRSAAILERDRK